MVLNRIFGLREGLLALNMIIGFSHGIIVGQTPGDQSKLKGVHPGYDLFSLTPPGFQPQVSGMDFMSDGRLVVCTWGGTHAKLSPPTQNGDVYILDNIAQNDSSKVTYKTFATRLQEPLGLKVVNDTIYLSERQALSALVDANKNGSMESSEYRKIATYASGAERHEFFFGLLYKDGNFYGAHSLSLVNGGAAALPQPNANRGTYVKINKATGKTEHISGGARQPFGLCMNPSGEIFSTDVQGTWNPFSSFTQVRPGRFYGHPQIGQVPPSPFDNMPYNPPAVILPQSDISNSPGQPVYIENGVFKDQFFYGDESYGGIQRIFLEKVNGEYQGAVFRFSAGFNSGVSRLAFAPNGDLIVGQIGDDGGGNWLETGKDIYGLQKLKANGKSAFEMLSVRSRPQGMEIEFTEDVAADANLVSNYQVKSWRYTRTSQYGGNPIDVKSLPVTAVQVSANKRKVYLAVSGLEADRLVYIRLAGLKSAAGKTPWSTEAWYTLNAIGSGNPFDPPTGLTRSPVKLDRGSLIVSKSSGRINFRIAVRGEYQLLVQDAMGTTHAKFSGHDDQGQSMNQSNLKPGAYFVSLKVGQVTWTQPLALF